jgi:hypothetical protein
MPRKRQEVLVTFHKRLMPVALSPAALAVACDLERRHIDKMISDGHLPVYRIGASRRVLVDDAVEAFRHHWKQGKKP